ncbi:MAG: hypothetical protein ACI3ZC_09085 [Candidatus Cryptobacteroides sp.]
MDLYDIFLIVLIVLIFIPQAVARKLLEKSKRTHPKTIRPEIFFPEFEDDEELAGEMDDLEPEVGSESSGAPIPEIQRQSMPAVDSPVPPQTVVPVPAAPAQAPAATSSAVPATVAPRIPAAEQPAPSEETPKFRVNPKEMILYSSIMEPKFKDN